MTKRLRRILTTVLFLALGVSCGATTGGEAGNTNWLAPCTSDATCGEGFACVCGLCTLACTKHEQCGELASTGVCLEPRGDVVRQCSQSLGTGEGLCVPSCSDDGVCAAGRECIANVCIPPDFMARDGDGGDTITGAAGAGQDGGFADGSGGAGGEGTGGAVPVAGSGGGSVVGSNPLPLTDASQLSLCGNVPTSPTPTSTEAAERADLIAMYCATLETYPCLWVQGELSDYTETCTTTERIEACRIDTTLEYNTSIPPACDGEWRTSIQCATAASYTCDDPLRQGLTPVNDDGISVDPPCGDERQALQDCVDGENPYIQITGARTTCGYAFNVPGYCEIQCELEGNIFRGQCMGAVEGPYECTCSVNEVALVDEGYGYNPRIFGADCADAARHMADGECVDRLDCCFTWSIDGQEGCGCTGDPERLGHESCEAVALAVNGEVVEICDYYRPDRYGLPIERSTP